MKSSTILAADTSATPALDLTGCKRDAAYRIDIYSTAAKSTLDATIYVCAAHDAPLTDAITAGGYNPMRIPVSDLAQMQIEVGSEPTRCNTRFGYSTIRSPLPTLLAATGPNVRRDRTATLIAVARLVADTALPAPLDVRFFPDGDGDEVSLGFDTAEEAEAWNDYLGFDDARVQAYTPKGVDAPGRLYNGGGQWRGAVLRVTGFSPADTNTGSAVA